MICEINSAFSPKAIKRSPKSWAMAKTSVDAEWKVARSVRRQGERNEMKLLLLCAVPKVTEWKKCSEQVRRNAWNEVTGGTGTIFENFYGTGCRKLLNAVREERMNGMKVLKVLKVQGNINRNFILGWQKTNVSLQWKWFFCRAMHKAFRLNSETCTEKLRIVSSGADETATGEMPGHWNSDYGNGKELFPNHVT